MTTKRLLGARIKELRKAKGFSQEELAEKIGIDSKHMSRIEVGGSFPSLDTLENIGKELKVEMKDFFEFAHTTESQKELKETIQGLLKEATEEKLKTVVKILRAVVR